MMTTTDTMDMLGAVMKSPEMLYRTILSALSSIRSEGGTVEVSISTDEWLRSLPPFRTYFELSARNFLPVILIRRETGWTRTVTMPETDECRFFPKDRTDREIAAYVSATACDRGDDWKRWYIGRTFPVYIEQGVRLAMDDVGYRLRGVMSDAGLSGIIVDVTRVS